MTHLFNDPVARSYLGVGPDSEEHTENKTMTEKPDLEKFDPAEWEFSASIPQRDAIRVMDEGGIVWNGHLQMYFRLRDDGVFCCFYTTKPREWTPIALPNGGGWYIVVPRPKPLPAKPAEPTADEILNALRDGKRVVDADGDEVAICYHAHGEWDVGTRFPLTIKPEPKPRRRVSREEAIIAMVRDSGQHAWDSGGKKYCCDLGVNKWWNEIDGKWVVLTQPLSDTLYLDPPEGK